MKAAVLRKIGQPLCIEDIPVPEIAADRVNGKDTLDFPVLPERWLILACLAGDSAFITLVQVFVPRDAASQVNRKELNYGPDRWRTRSRPDRSHL